ncbi:MAG: cytochrome c [Ottowia sp.]|nr:cytochrome c [Ottowia sp.]
MPIDSRGRRPEEREYVDPEERTRPMPIVAAAVAIGMFVWGLVYIGISGPYTPPQYGDQRTLADLSGTPAVAEAGAAVDGKAVFAANCAACHQATGAGLPGVFPPLDGSEWVQGKPVVLANILLHGIEGELEVHGTTYNGQMPAFPQLSDAELAGVATYIRGEWSNDADPIDAELFATEREAARRDSPFNGTEDLKKLEAES